MLNTVGEVLEAYTQGNELVPPGMMGSDCHPTHEGVEEAFLGLATVETLAGKPFFGAFSTFTEVFGCAMLLDAHACMCV